MLLETDTCCSESNQPERVVQGEVIFYLFLATARIGDGIGLLMYLKVCYTARR